VVDKSARVFSLWRPTDSGRGVENAKYLPEREIAMANEIEDKIRVAIGLDFCWFCSDDAGHSRKRNASPQMIERRCPVARLFSWAAAVDSGLSRQVNSKVLFFAPRRPYEDCSALFASLTLVIFEKQVTRFAASRPLVPTERSYIDFGIR